MRASHKLGATVLGAALLFAGVACSGGSDDADEAPTSTTSGAKVEVDTEAGSPVEFSDGEGNTAEYGEDASLPDGWPKELTPPTTVKLVSSSTADTGGQTQLFVTGESTAPFADLHQGIKDQLTAAGFTITNDVTTDAEGGSGGFAGVEATSDDFAASISIAEDPDATTVTILYTLTPATS